MNNRISGIALAAAIGAAGFTSAQAAEIRLTIGAGHPGASLWNKTVIDFFMPRLAERVAAETGDTIVWTEAWGGTLCKLEDCLESLGSGILDIVNIQVPQEPSKLRAALFSLYAPFSSTDPRVVAEAGRAVYEKVPGIVDLYKANGSIPLAPSAVGNYGIITTFTWDNVSELNGKKLGAAGPNLPWLEGTGVVGVQSTLNDGYTSMQTGVYDGFLNFAASDVSFKFYEVADQFTSVGFGAQVFTVLSMNLDRFEALSPELQTIFVEVATEWSEYNAQVFYDNEQESFEILRSHDHRILELPADQQAAWANSLSNIAKINSEEITASGQPGESIYVFVDTLKELGVTLPRDWSAER